MPRPIRILPPAIAEKIAAGEVIERPASVVKELLENALDAGATRVQVTLEDGGKQLIEVADNGHGMAADDLERSIQRHATSKVSALEDLERIRTLGFRGEALPSIGAVSELSILTRDESVRSSTAYRLSEGRVEKVTHGEFLGSMHGTRVQARGLFATFPARLKFLRAASAEVSAVRDWMERLAISRPDVAFTLLSGGKELLRLPTPPSDAAESAEVARVRAILAEGEDYPILLGQAEGVRAYWVQGLSVPTLRKTAQVINGRSVRDRAVQQALLQPFRQTLLPGQFPAVAVYLDLPPGEVDVNVHPSKAEVRFLRSSEIFSRVARALEGLIEEHGAPGFVAGSSFSLQSESAAPAFSPTLSSPARAWQPTLSAAEPASPEPAASADSVAIDAPASTYLGPLFSTYLAFDLGDELLLIDQHAAHERVRYESLRLRHHRGQSQALLIPEIVGFRAEDRARLESALPALAAIGLEAELFGQDKLLVRATPWAVSPGESEELRTRLKNLVERVVHRPDSAKVDATLVDEISFETLASRACRSSVMAGDRLSPEQAITLHRDLMRSEHPWNCPHGRPTTVRIPRARFEEWFQRRV